jgi:hypothetical protein
MACRMGTPLEEANPINIDFAGCLESELFAIL